MLTKFQFDEREIELVVPDGEEVRLQYLSARKLNPATPFPYWAKVWPSSIALCKFLAKHVHYINGKNIAELGAGLALPSIFAALYARSVATSDHAAEAMELVKESILHAQLNNITTAILSWQELPVNFNPDVILLSDVNYHAEDFPALLSILQSFIHKNITIILSTPQRIVGKEFIEPLLKYCSLREDIAIQETMISVFVMEIS